MARSVVLQIWVSRGEREECGGGVACGYGGTAAAHAALRGGASRLVYREGGESCREEEERVD